ncbi:hypothetical protein, variant 1 [Capsaspora owczarzaki ATCC 30864]|nr:hypothetical protein, variant 1 [Capsaspora owczarzaki ATCC 30864]
MLDGRDDTCWNSDQGKSQTVSIELDQPVTIAGVRIMFQGGFVGNRCRIEVERSPAQQEAAAGVSPSGESSLASSASASEQPGLANDASTGSTTARKYDVLCTIYPEDNNTLQEFPFPSSQEVQRMRFVFEASTDFFGRVTVYRLELLQATC